VWIRQGFHLSDVTCGSQLEKGFVMKSNKPTLHKVFHEPNLTCAAQYQISSMALSEHSVNLNIVQPRKELYVALSSVHEHLCRAKFYINLNLAKHLFCSNR